MNEMVNQGRGKRFHLHAVTLLMLACAQMIVLLTYARGTALLAGYAAVWLAGVTAVQLSHHYRRLPAAYWMGLALAAWYAATRVINGDHYLQATEARYTATALMGIFGLAFPAAACLRDAHKRYVLDALVLAVVLMFALINGVGVLAAVQGRVICLPFFGNEFGIMRDGRLWVLGINPFYTSTFGVCGAFLLLYLAAYHRSRWLALPVAALEIIFLASVRLSGSRTGMILFGLGGFMTAGVVLPRLFPPIRNRLWLRVLCVALAALVVVFALAGAADLVSEDRDLKPRRSFLSVLGTLSDRTIVWEAVIPVFREQPLRLLTGFPEGELQRALNAEVRYGYYNHMHNAFLQTLMLGGLPALLMAIALTIRVMWAGWKILRFGPCSMKILVVYLALYLIQMMLEPYLFLDASIFNFLFWLVAGYAGELAKDLTPPQNKPRAAQTAAV